MPYAWRVLIGACLGQLGALGLGRFTYAALLPGMRDGLGLSYTESGLPATANLFGFLLGSLVVGQLTARFGARRVVAGALLTVAASLAATGVAPNLTVALLAQFITGIGSTCAAVPTIGLIIPWFTSARRGVAGGVCVAGAGIGSLIGSATAPALALALSGGEPAVAWRFAWYTLAALELVTAVLAITLIRNRPADVGAEAWGPPDHSTGEGRRWVGIVPQRAVAGRPVWQDPVLLYLGLLYVGFGLTYTSYSTFLPAMLVGNGWPQVEAARLWAIVGVAGIPGAIGWGQLSDRIGRPLALSSAFLLMASAAALLLATADRLALVSALMFGLSLFTIPTTMSISAGDRVGARQVYAAVSFLHVWSGVGQVVGPVLVGAAIDWSQSFTAAYAFSTVIGGLAATLALGLALWQERARPRPQVVPTGPTEP